MKFLQFFNIYDTCLHEMSRQDPLLFTRPFAQQMEAMWKFGFSTGYLFAPYMQRLGYESNYVVTNCRESQLQWMKEHGLTLQYPDHWQIEVAWHQVNHYKPDVVFITEPLTLDSKFLRMLAHKPKVVLGWRASIIPEGTDWSEFDVILTNLSALREIAVRLGAKSAKHFWPGFERRIIEEVKTQPYTHDLTFCGQWTRHHRVRNQLVADLVQADQENTLGFSLGLYVSGDMGIMPPHVKARSSGPKFGLDYYKVVKSGAMALDARGTDLYGTDPTTGQRIDLFKGETGTYRMLEVTGTGAMLMAEHYDVLQKYFKIGTEMETFRSKEELIEKVRYFKAHPQECALIARRGQERCLREYSMEVRVEELDFIIRATLARRSGAQVSPPNRIHPDLAKATKAILAGEFESALTALSLYDGENVFVPNLMYVKARALLGVGNKVEAERALMQELLRNPSNVAATQLLASLRSPMQSHSRAYSSIELVHTFID